MKAFNCHWHAAPNGYVAVAATAASADAVYSAHDVTELPSVMSTLQYILSLDTMLPHPQQLTIRDSDYWAVLATSVPIHSTYLA